MILIIICIAIILRGFFYVVIRVNIKNEKPDDLYIKMSEINDSQTLIGLLPEEVVELIGKPEYESKDISGEKLYNYYAGK